MSSAHAHRALASAPVSGFFARVTPRADAPEAGGVPMESAAASSHLLVVSGPRAARIGGRSIDPGTYRLRIDDARERIVLENHERTHVLTAFLRRATSQAHDPIEAWLEPADAHGRRLLVVRLSNGCEWVA